MSVPPFLYKYMAARTATVVLENQTLRWSNPSVFNDVSEFRRLPEFRPDLKQALIELPARIVKIAAGDLVVEEGSLSENARFLVESTRLSLGSGMDRTELIEELSGDIGEPDQRHRELMEQFWNDEKLRTARILCLTVTPDNGVMWGNYAENHSGAVLGFRHVPELDTPLQVAEPVHYQDELPSIGSGINFLLYGDTRDLREQAVRSVCFTKKSSWSYENEWRVVTWRPEEGSAEYGDYRFDTLELESVTFGARCTKSTLSALRSIIRDKYPATRFFRMAVDSGELKRTDDG